MNEATLNNIQFHMTKQLKAKREKVYQAFANPAQMAEWFGYEGTQMEADVKVDGHYTITMHAPDGNEYIVGGVYREVVEGEKLVFTWKWNFQPDDQPFSLVTVQLQDIDDGTELSLTHEKFADEVLRDRNEEGWGKALVSLETYLKTV